MKKSRNAPKNDSLWKAFGKIKQVEDDNKVLYAIANVMREFHCGYEETLRMPLPTLLALNNLLYEQEKKNKKMK